MAAASAGALISSIATASGAAARRSRSAASLFGAPLNTSVQRPTSKPGLPPVIPASSPRSSASATRTPASDCVRTSSRRKVVFPPPGGEITSTDFPSNAGRISRPAPGTGRATRIHSDETSRIVRIAPAALTAVPQTPTRTPPGAQT